MENGQEVYVVYSVTMGELIPLIVKVFKDKDKAETYRKALNLTEDGKTYLVQKHTVVK